jgi:hypothetical protein
MQPGVKSRSQGASRSRRIGCHLALSPAAIGLGCQATNKASLPGSTGTTYCFSCVTGITFQGRGGRARDSARYLIQQGEILCQGLT